MAEKIACALLACAALTGPAALAAQDRHDFWLPDVRHFRSPFADPIEPRLSIGLLATDVLSTQGPERPAFVIGDPDDADFDVQAQAAIGVTIPFVNLGEWEGGGITLTGMAGVFSRFRIEYPSRDDLGQDWIVGGGIEAAWDEVSTRVRISHQIGRAHV